VDHWTVDQDHGVDGAGGAFVSVWRCCGLSEVRVTREQTEEWSCRCLRWWQRAQGGGV